MCMVGVMYNMLGESAGSVLFSLYPLHGTKTVLFLIPKSKLEQRKLVSGKSPKQQVKPFIKESEFLLSKVFHRVLPPFTMAVQ